MGTAWRTAAAAGALAMFAPGAAWAQGGPQNGFGVADGVNGTDGAVEYVRVCDAYGTGFFYIPGTETCLRIGGRVRASNFDIDDDIGIGTVIRGVGLETFIGRYDDRLTGTGGDLSISYTSGYWSHGLKGSFDFAEDDFVGEVPIGGHASGYTFGTDMYGSTGIFLGMTGSQVSGDLDYSRYEFTYKAMRVFDPYAGLTPQERTRSKKQLGLAVSYERTSLEQDGWLQSLTFPNNIEIWNSHELDSNAIGLGPAIAGTHYFASGFFIRAAADLQLVYRQTDFTSWENIYCDICGGLPMQFIIAIDESKDEVTWKGGVDADVGYNFTPNFAMKVGAGLDIADRQAIDIRENPNDRDTGIRDYTALDYHFRVSAHVKF